MAKLINNIFYFYYILIILRIFMTWIPTIDWEAEPMKTLRNITDWYLDIFRRVVPPIGGLDFSPVIALIALEIIQVILTTFIGSIFG